MTASRVLVAYASKRGGTQEIAQWIGRELTEQGVEAVVMSAARVADVHCYDAVVLGSGVYAGRWLREAVRFTRRHRKALLGLPVWLFSSGPLDPSAGARDIPPVPGAVRVGDRIDAVGHATFGGRLTAAAGGFVTRQILAQGRGGDFRDRAQVSAWTRRVADGVRSGSSGAGGTLQSDGAVGSARSECGRYRGV